MIGALAALDALGAVALVVDDERVPVRVTEKVHENREIEVRAVERGGDREFRVRTEWAAGWLDPAVGVRTDPDDLFCPAASLDGVEVAAVSRQGRQRESPPPADARPWRA